jgi:hypothetical protein
MGESFVLDLGRKPPVNCPCGLEGASLFCASLIEQPWQQKNDTMSSQCRCKKWYWSWGDMRWKKTRTE